jgi:hypothetical protein
MIFQTMQMIKTKKLNFQLITGPQLIKVTQIMKSESIVAKKIQETKVKTKVTRRALKF